MYHATTLFAMLGAMAAARASEDCTNPKLAVTGAVIADHTHYVPEGRPVEVFCSGDPKALAMFEFTTKLRTEVLNTTTIWYFIKNPSTGHMRLFSCQNACGVDYGWVKAESYPGISKFSCHSNNLELLVCSWSTGTDHGHYTLSYTHADGTFIAEVCKGFLNKMHHTCAWDMNNVENSKRGNGSLTLHLQVCSNLGCDNKTLHIDILSVTKLNAPGIISIRANGPYSAVVDWIPTIGWLVPSLEIYFTIEYEITGVEPNVIIANATRISQHMTLRHHLELPCPDKLYTVRLSYRPARATPIYMSDFAFASVQTESKPNGGELRPMCILIIAEQVKYKIKLLRWHVLEELDKLNKQRETRTRKLNKIEVISIVSSHIAEFEIR